MNTVVRLFLLFVLAGSLTALVLGSGALAMPQQPSAPAPGTQSVSNVIEPNTSYDENPSDTNALNWAGYVATVGTYTSVSGSWTVPTVAVGASNDVADATWVGIGGVVTNDLIQAGTEAVPNSDGSISYQAWMETLPQDSRVIPLSVSPGDSVSVSITEASTGVWDVSFDDATTGKTYETSVQYNSSLSSADWVEEMPVEVGGVVALDDFGEVDFTNGYAIKNGEPVTIESSGAQPLTMDNSEGQAVATPSSIGADGSSFSVARTDAPSTPLALADGVQAVPISAYGSYASAGGYGGYGGGSGYSTHVHRGRGGYRIVVQF